MSVLVFYVSNTRGETCLDCFVKQLFIPPLLCILSIASIFCSVATVMRLDKNNVKRRFFPILHHDRK